MTSTAQWVTRTVHALMHATGETQTVLAAGLQLSQPAVSLRLSGRRAWTLDDLDALAAHYGIPVPDLVAGVDAALRRLPVARRAAVCGGTQTTIPPTARP